MDICMLYIYIYTYIYIWYMYLLLLWWWYRVVNCPQSLLWTGSACLLEHSGAGAGGGQKSLFWTLMLFGKNIENHSTDMLLQCRFGIGWKILAQGSVVVCRWPTCERGSSRNRAGDRNGTTMDHEPGKLQVCKSPKIKDLVGETTKMVCR